MVEMTDEEYSAYEKRQKAYQDSEEGQKELAEMQEHRREYEERTKSKKTAVPEAIEGSKGSPIESTSSDISTEPPERSVYSHDDSTVSRTAQQTHEDWVKPRKSEEAPATGTPLAKAIERTHTGVADIAHNEDWLQEKDTARNTTRLPVGFPRKRNVTEIPEPTPARSTWRSNDPRTMGTPIDSPLFKEAPKESLVAKLTEAPRRLKEKGEEIGFAAQQRYHNAREVPAESAARERYEMRMAENDTKFHKGEISSTMHKSRQMEYATAFESEKKPTEQWVVKTTLDVGNAFYKGLQHTQQKVADEYRSSPAPRIKSSQGTVASRIGKIGVTPMRTATRKGKQVGAEQPQRINFGNGGINTGSGIGSGSAIDFTGGSSLFGKKEPEKKKRK